MDLPENLFRRRLQAGTAQVGVWHAITDPLVSEALAGCGFDFVVIDTEHARTDVPETLGMMQAMAAYPVGVAVRPAANDPVTIKRLLDLGAQTLIVPMVNTAAEAAAAVSAMRYAPRGIRGVAGTTRATRFGAVQGYAQRAEEALCLMVQIETVAAVEAIEAIAAVDGVDGLFLGPADLAASMGFPGQAGRPEVQEAVEAAVRRIVATGRAAGLMTLDLALARRCIALGATVAAVGADMSLLLAGARGLVASFQS